MEKLLKMEKYQFLHNFVYWCGMIGIFVLGFFTADTYVPEVMGPAGGKASSLADIFNGMVYDSTFLLIIISGLLALSFGQEFSGRTITLEVLCIRLQDVSENLESLVWKMVGYFFIM